MDASTKYLLDNLTEGLSILSRSLEKLSFSTNGEFSKVRADISQVIKEIELIKAQKCPRDKPAILEIIEHERLKQQNSQPANLRAIILWIVAILGGIMSIILGLDKLIN